MIAIGNLFEVMTSVMDLPNAKANMTRGLQQQEHNIKENQPSKVELDNGKISMSTGPVVNPIVSDDL